VETSTSVEVTPSTSELPTATQAPAEEQSTPARVLLVAPFGFGVDWILHADPFHPSASVDDGVPLLLVDQSPTAMHSALRRPRG
jgi:hypothetical protein